MTEDLIPVRAVLGLKDRNDEDWGELRALQLSRFEQGMDVRMGLMALLCLVLGVALIDLVPRMMVASWVILNCSIALGILVLRRKSLAPMSKACACRPHSTLLGRSLVFYISLKGLARWPRTARTITTVMAI